MYLNGLTVKMSFELKNLNGQYIDYSEKKMAQGLHLPLYWDIRIYSRSQVSVYRTIGPLVYCTCGAREMMAF